MRSRTGPAPALAVLLAGLAAEVGQRLRAEQLALMTRSTGAAFDRLLVTSMRAHFDQCVSLAGSEQKAGREPAVKALAAAVESGRGSDLRLLAGLPGSA